MYMNSEEFLEVVDRDGNAIWVAPRSEIHGNPALIHKVVHVLVFNKKGELLLQKRSASKDVAPGKWDTSVGGHVNPDEALPAAAKREMKEELGIDAQLTYLYSYMHTNSYETEIVYTYSCVHDSEIIFDRLEIDEVRYWSLEEIRERISDKIFSDNFGDEFKNYTALVSCP